MEFQSRRKIAPTRKEVELQYPDNSKNAENPRKFAYSYWWELEEDRTELVLFESTLTEETKKEAA